MFFSLRYGKLSVTAQSADVTFRDHNFTLSGSIAKPTTRFCFCTCVVMNCTLSHQLLRGTTQVKPPQDKHAQECSVVLGGLL